jgi:hypothetical protein
MIFELAASSSRAAYVRGFSFTLIVLATGDHHEHRDQRHLLGTFWRHFRAASGTVALRRTCSPVWADQSAAHTYRTYSPDAGTERHFLSAFSKKPGRQPGLRRTLKFGAGQFRRTG